MIDTLRNARNKINVVLLSIVVFYVLRRRLVVQGLIIIIIIISPLTIVSKDQWGDVKSYNAALCREYISFQLMSYD